MLEDEIPKMRSQSALRSIFQCRDGFRAELFISSVEVAPNGEASLVISESFGGKDVEHTVYGGDAFQTLEFGLLRARLLVMEWLEEKGDVLTCNNIPIECHMRFAPRSR